MNYDQFIAELKKSDEFYIEEPQKGKREYWQTDYSWRTAHTIEQDWRTGGVSGGNCWNDGGHYSLDSDPTPTTWPEFDKLIERYWPTITFMEYRRIMQPLIKQHTLRQSEYYGNYTNYAHNVINLKEFFTVLKENGKL